MRVFGLALLVLAACGGGTTNDKDGGTSGGPLTPGAAGEGHLAYLVETRSGRELEVVNLTTARVEYRSGEADGEISHFFLSADGSTAVFRSAAKPCVKVALSAGTTSDCTPAGVMLPYITGISNDGAQLSFTGNDSTTFATVRVLRDGSSDTVLRDAPADGKTQSSGGGGISPDGEFIYEFRFDSNGGVNPPLTLLKYPRDGAPPTVVFDETADVRARSIIDLVLQQNEAGTRGLFACFDGAQAVVGERISTCAVDLVSGAVTLIPNAIGSLSLDGTQLVTVPPFASGYRLYDFGATTPSRSITLNGGSVALSPDAQRLAYRMREDGVFYVSATVPVAGGTPVRVQRDDPTSRASPEFLLWKH